MDEELKGYDDRYKKELLYLGIKLMESFYDEDGELIPDRVKEYSSSKDGNIFMVINQISSQNSDEVQNQLKCESDVKRSKFDMIGHMFSSCSDNAVRLIGKALYHSLDKKHLRYQDMGEFISAQDQKFKEKIDKDW